MESVKDFLIKSAYMVGYIKGLVSGYIRGFSQAIKERFFEK